MSHKVCFKTLNNGGESSRKSFAKLLTFQNDCAKIDDVIGLAHAKSDKVNVAQHTLCEIRRRCRGFFATMDL